MTPINWDKEFKCRASAVNKIMATKQGTKVISESGLKRIAELEARTKEMTDKMKEEYAALVTLRDTPPKVELADGCIQYLMEAYAWHTEGMISVGKESIETLAMRKGRIQEKVSKELLELVDGVIYKIHKERISNEYLSGEIDLYLGESVYEATTIADIKNAEDYVKFLRNIHTGLINGQRDQVATYCDITGAKEGFIIHTVVDHTEEDIVEMQMRIARKVGCIDPNSPDFLSEWEKWERSMRVSHIPPRKRVHKIPVELFSDFEKQAIYDRVKLCREFLWKFDEQRQKLN